MNRGLNNLELLLEELLFEGRFEDAQKKYPEVAEELAKLKAAGVDSKYAQWFAKRYQELNKWEKAEVPLEKAIALLKSYDFFLKKKLITHPQNRDINHWGKGEWEFFQNFVEGMESDQTKRDEEKARANDKEVIYKDDRYLVIKPNTTEASCRFGKGTKWCITAKEVNQFQNYTEKGAKFYFFIDRKNKDQGGKDALAVTGYGIEIYDAQDHIQNFDYLLNKYPPKMHDLIFNLTYGTTTAGFKDFLSSPYETIAALDTEGSNIEQVVKTFYDEMVSNKLGPEIEANILLKLFQKIDPQNIPEAVAIYVDLSYWRFFNSWNVSNELLNQMYETSKKFLGHPDEGYYESFSVIPLTLLDHLAKRILEIDIAIKIMREWLFLYDYYINKEEHKLSSVAGNLVTGPTPLYAYDIYKADPKLFEKFMLRYLTIFPAWVDKNSFDNWFGSYLAGKYNLSLAVTTRFLIKIAPLWKKHQELAAVGKADQMRNFLPIYLRRKVFLRTKGRLSAADNNEVKANIDLLLQLLQKSKGNKTALLPGNLANLSEIQHQKALAFIREDMKRFFPELIED